MSYKWGKNQDSFPLPGLFCNEFTFFITNNSKTFELFPEFGRISSVTAFTLTLLRMRVFYKSAPRPPVSQTPRGIGVSLLLTVRGPIQQLELPSESPPFHDPVKMSTDEGKVPDAAEDSSPSPMCTDRMDQSEI